MPNLNGLSLIVLNLGDKRASYCVQIVEHVNANQEPIVLTRRSIDALRELLEIGRQYESPQDRLVKTISEKLRKFPGGDEIYNHLEMNGVEVLDYIDACNLAFKNQLDTTAGSTSSESRAARGQGYITKGKKLLTASLAKACCVLAEPSQDGKISDVMFEKGLEEAIKLLQEIQNNKVEIFAIATKTANKAGLDENGRVRLRAASGAGEDDAE